MGADSGHIPYLKEKFPGKILDSHAFRGEETIVIAREGMRDIFRSLREDPGLAFDLLADVTTVDYLGRKQPRFEVVYHLYSLPRNTRLRVKVRVPEEDPVVDSLTALWKGANWLEREAWDMFGIRFRGHPDLRRILLYEEFQGYPLRKDYPVNQRQPLVPEREVRGTFVDRKSDDRLLQLKRKFAPGSKAG